MQVILKFVSAISVRWSDRLSKIVFSSLNSYCVVLRTVYARNLFLPSDQLLHDSATIQTSKKKVSMMVSQNGC